MSHVQRFDHIGITVADLDTVTAFFVALGLVVEGRTFVEGPTARYATAGKSAPASLTSRAETHGRICTRNLVAGSGIGLSCRPRRDEATTPLKIGRF